MTAYVEECRKEWKRLGVPDSLADEMATDVEADLAEAEADGVSAAEMLGESDPRRFAATWAKERGLVEEPPPKRSRRRLWLALAVALLLFLVIVPATFIGLALATSTATVHLQKNLARPVRSVVIPNFVGLKACHSRRIALESGLKVRRFPHSRCSAVVIAQRPLRGTLVAWPHGAHTVVKFRLRG